MYRTGERFVGREVPIHMPVDHRVGRKGVAYFDYILEPVRDASGEVTALFALGTDVTDLVLARRAATQMQSRWQQLIEDIDAVVWEADAATFQFTFVSQKAEAITGHPVARWFEQGFWTSIIHEEDREQALSYCLGCMEAGETSFDFEYRCVTADGRVVWFHDLVHVLGDEHGAPRALRGIMVDITARKAAEAEARAMHAQLLHVQKLESLGILAGGIAHDFNNLLTGILGNASLATLELDAAHPARRRIDAIVSAAKTAADLTRQLLAYSGKGHFQVRSVDVCARIRDIVALLETTLPKTVHLRLELAADLPVVEADAGQLQQVIMNLVINGAEACGDSPGQVIIATGEIECDARYMRGLDLPHELAPGRYVYIEVHDDGCGLGEGARRRMFDPFYTTKATGRGLGLAAVSGIVRGHKGAIKVYSTEGQGTTFKVLLPASEAAPGAAEEVPETAIRVGGLVLVVDDEAHVRVVARSMLEHLGYDVLEAEDGYEALDLFRARGAEIACVLLDMTMPQMSGEQVFRSLRGLRDDVPVLLSSGYNEVEATGRFAGKGLAGFLQKPYTLAQLTDALARCQTGTGV